MVIALMGDNCTGKSAIAACIAEKTGAEIITGKDYLRLAKSESMAGALFKKKLAQAVTDGSIVYVLSEKEQLGFLPQGCLQVLVTASLDSIKQRFAARMRGTLTPPIAAMLDRRYGQFESDAHELRIDTDATSPQDACSVILQRAEL